MSIETILFLSFWVLGLVYGLTSLIHFIVLDEIVRGFTKEYAIITALAVVSIFSFAYSGGYLFYWFFHYWAFGRLFIVPSHIFGTSLIIASVIILRVYRHTQLYQTNKSLSEK